MSNSTLALIIGGSSGIGLACAKQLVALGIDILLLGNNATKLEKAKTELGNSTIVKIIQANLYDASDVEQVIESITKQQRHIQYLVNAAGYFNPKPFLEHTTEDYDAYQDLNKSTFFISQAVAKNMAMHAGGSIVHIGSMWAKQAIKATPSSAYSMAKAG